MRSRLIGFISLAMSATAIFGGSASAAPPTVTFDLFSPSATLTPGDYTTFELRYNVSGANLSNVQIVWDMPAGLLPVGAAAAGDFTVVCAPQDSPTNYDWICTWTAASIVVPGGGVSGSLPVGIEFLRWHFLAGTGVSTSATLNASWNDGVTTGSTGPVTGSETVTLAGVASPTATVTWDQQTPTGYGYLDGVAGNTSRVVVSVTNDGAIGIETNSLVTVSLPSDARIVRHVAYDPSTLLTNLGDTGPFVVRLDVPMGSTSVSAIPMPAISKDGHTFFDLIIWRPCSAEPYLATEQAAVSWSGTVMGQSQAVLATSSVPPHDNLKTPNAADRCDSDAYLGWGSSAPIGAGATSTFATTAKPPSPVAEAYDVFFSVRLPGAMAFERNPRIEDDGDFDGFPTDGTIYLCNITDATPPLTALEFAVYRSTSACTDVSLSWGPVARTDATHVVFERATWGYDFGDEVLLWKSLGVWMSMYETTCTATSVTFGSYLSFREAPGGALTELTASQTRTVRAESSPRVSVPVVPAATTRGATQTIVVSVSNGSGYAPALNPVVRIPIPTGVTVQNVSWAVYATGCATPPPLLGSWYLDNTTSPPTLVIPTGNSANPWYLNPASCVCGPSGPLTLGIRLYFDANHPFINGQVVPFAASVNADNVGPTFVPVTRTGSTSMLVPAEMRLTVEPACDTSPQAYPSFRVGFANSGGVPLANVEAIFDIPTGTNLIDVVATLGTPECDSGSGWSTTCGASATRVRVFLASLSPYQSGYMTIRLDPLSTPAGTAIYGSGSLSTSSGLGTIASAPDNPAIVGTCPGQLDLQAWWDDANPGVLNSGELGAPGWSAIVTNTVTNDTLNIALGPSGLSSTMLPPGTYSLVFVEPGDASASWTILPTPPTTVTILASQTTYVGFGVSCACADLDSCTLDSCTRGGECVNALPPEGCCGNGLVNVGEHCDDGNGNPYDGCYRCFCSYYGYSMSNGACQPTCGDGLVIAPEQCDDGNLLSDDGCSSTCVLEPGASCEPLVVDQCLPTFLCGETLPSWVNVGNPAFGWVLVLRGDLGPESACGMSPIDCAALPSTCPADDVDCLNQQYLCGFCDSMGITVCEACGPEICNGLNDDCDGEVDDGCDDDEDGFCDDGMMYDPTTGTAIACEPGDCDDTDPLTPSQCPTEGGGRIFGEVMTAGGPRAFRCTYVAGQAPDCEVERDGSGNPILSNGHPVLALFADLVCE